MNPLLAVLSVIAVVFGFVVGVGAIRDYRRWRTIGWAAIVASAFCVALLGGLVLWRMAV